jgi:diguanylate cyclase (GGDEF)-like protein
MHLDPNTLSLVTIYVEAILGLLLLFAWIQNTGIRAVAWWGCAHLLATFSLVLYRMSGTVPDLVSLDVANVILLTTFAITWTGARLFNDRSPSMAGLLAGAVIWLVLCRIPPFAGLLHDRILIGSAIIAAYIWLTAYEFCRGKAEPLVSRWPAILILFAYGSLLLLRRVPMGSSADQVFGSVWPNVLGVDALLFAISVAFILLAMARERTELRHKLAAMLDPLTGITNRRTFFHQAAQFAQRQLANPPPLTVLLLDLDHFRSINDRFGDAIGDRVLQVFAKAASAQLGPADLIARIGGEEFGVVLSDAAGEQALSTAERIRLEFADAARYVDGELVGATVSIGMAVSAGGVIEIPLLLTQADQALGRAKARGRNRVEVAELALAAKQSAAVARVQTAA